MSGDSTKTLTVPGFTIGALAVASGTDLFDAALGLATVLGGIAGPMAAIDGPAGDQIHPGLNLVSSGRDHAPWRRLEELLLAPVDACQKMMRDLSRAANPDRLDHLQFSPLADNTQAIDERSKAGLFHQPGIPVGYVDDRRHLAILRTPSCMLRAPDGETFAKAIPEVMDAHALVIYEDLFASLLARPTGKEKHPLGPRLAAAIGGHDEFTVRDKQVGPGSLDVVRANLLITTTREQLGQALAADDKAVQAILRHSVFLNPSSPTVGADVNLQNIRWGYLAYGKALKQVLDARRSGEGFQIIPKPEGLASLHAFTVELQEWCRRLPTRLQPYFSRSLGLPYRLHWSFLATLAPRETDEWVLPFTMSVTRQILDRQRQFLDNILTDAETAGHHRERITMLWKLADKPLVMRDLLRRYRVQKLEVHEPVLAELIDEQLVTRHGDGLLELTAQGRSHLAAA